MTELEKLMQSIDPSVLQKLRGFAASDEGAKLLKNLSGESKDELIKKISAMSENDKNALIKKAMQNPSLLSKIKEML